MRIVVTGSHGQISRSLQERGKLLGIEVLTLSRPAIDLEHPHGIVDAVSALRPDAIVNAAAYTAVDQAETEPSKARAINAIGAGAVASCAATLGLPVVHISTDYVFSGDLARPYREDDPTGPKNVYGQSKLDGEHAVAAANANHVILRTAWVYSPFGKNFVKTMLALAKNRDTISVVSDQIGAPTGAQDIADGIVQVLVNLTRRPDAADLRGTFHMTADGEASWFEFAREIFKTSSRLGGQSATVLPITTQDYPTPAARPFNSRLDTGKLAEVHGVKLQNWRDALPNCVERLISESVPSSINYV